MIGDAVVPVNEPCIAILIGMARDIHDIERDIARHREELARTLDKLVEEASPKKAGQQFASLAQAKVKNEDFQKKILLGVAALGVVIVATVVTKRRDKKQVEKLRSLIQARREALR
ncbi:Protein of unknown function [Corynebacterium glucuronolyticum]|nr:hypothetical protein CGLUCO_10400 [Corynebacterium glucuronolyticum DSM 44120]SMB78400.1 Protein of unknown function [Corynebacterium glucuronolyticum]